jgi:NhaP-type Na+/H+ or K+/H+ antiporter
VFAVIVLNSKLPHSDLIAMTVACTILLSIIAHGITATPLVAAFAASIRRSAGKPVADKQG